MATGKRATKGKGRGKSLAPGKVKRGLDAAEIALAIDDERIVSLAAQVRERGGAPIGAYRDPLSGSTVLVAALPLATVQPTPFQRDLSPTHAKRLAQKIDEAGSFLDPIIVVRGEDGEFCTPNGRHRLAAAKVLGLKQITAPVSPDEGLAFRILALNTEKAHNLKDRSLEVIRMAKALARREPRAKESDYAAQFESPEFLTLGILYLKDPRFAGGAYGPALKASDSFSEAPIGETLELREARAERLLALDARVAELMEALRARGFQSPYLRNFVVARLRPFRPRGKPAPEADALLDHMEKAAAKFDAGKIREDQVASAAGGSEE